jgi:hypothetical protein
MRAVIKSSSCRRLHSNSLYGADIQSNRLYVHMKRPCQAFAVCWSAAEPVCPVMRFSRVCWRAWCTDPACRVMRCSGVLAGVPGGPAPGGAGPGLPALPARSGRRGSGVNGGRRPSRSDARQRTVEAGGAAAYHVGPPGTAHRGRWPGRVGTVYRVVVVAFATARLIFACRIRRSAVRRTVPHTYGESRLAQNIHGDHSCRGVRPGTPPAWDGRGCCPGAGGRGSAGHLRPHEAGQLAGDPHHGDAGRLAAGGHLGVLGVQPLLRLPGPG